MRVSLGTDLGSTTTKAILLDEGGEVLGRGITNSRSNYHLAAEIAQDEAFIGARFSLLERELPPGDKLLVRLEHQFRKEQHLSQLESLREVALAEAASSGALLERLEEIFRDMVETARRPKLDARHQTSEFFRDRAASEFGRLAEKHADRMIGFDLLVGIFDKSIIQVENQRMDLTFEGNIGRALNTCLEGVPEGERCRSAVVRALGVELEVGASIGTGYGRQRLPFPKESIRSEILCHGLGAHRMYPATRTVLDIGGQDTKAIQVDPDGIVTSFQMNDRCAAGCGRYLGYIADEMNLGVHELGPLAMESTRQVKINSTCTVFAGAELRDRLTLGQRREDILAGLHRAIILRAVALLARSGGVSDEFTFTGGVASNPAAVSALQELIEENYGERKINISPTSIYTGALGAALFGLRAMGGEPS